MERDKFFVSKLLKLPVPILKFNRKNNEWGVHRCSCEPLCSNDNIKSSKPWISFGEKKPPVNCGLLIIIDDNNDEDPWNVRDQLFYGFMWPHEYIYITLNITENVRMGWKAHKEFDLKDIYWFNGIECGSPNM